MLTRAWGSQIGHCPSPTCLGPGGAHFCRCESAGSPRVGLGPSRSVCGGNVSGVPDRRGAGWLILLRVSSLLQRCRRRVLLPPSRCRCRCRSRNRNRGRSRSWNRGRGWSRNRGRGQGRGCRRGQGRGRRWRVLSMALWHGGRLRSARAVAQVSQLVAVALDQAPSAMPFVFAAELLGLGRIVSCLCPVAHRGQFLGAEQLQLTNSIIIPGPAEGRCPGPPVDHAINCGGRHGMIPVRSLGITPLPARDGQFLVMRIHGSSGVPAPGQAAPV